MMWNFTFTKSLFMCSFYKLNPPEVRVLTVAPLGIDVMQVFELSPKAVIHSATFLEQLPGNFIDRVV